MKLSSAAIALALVSSSQGAVCNSANAKDWPIVLLPTDTAVQTCHKACVNEIIMVSKQSSCVQKCLALAGIGESNSAKRDVQRRATTLTCTSKETCYFYVDGYLCLDPNTGSYHNDVGGVGDVNTGAYSENGGGGAIGNDDKTTVSKKTAASTRSSSAAGTTAARTTPALSEGTVTSSANSVPTGTAAVAAATSTGGADRLYVGGVIGALGLAVGVIL